MKTMGEKITITSLQEFGNLIITDNTLNIISISEGAQSFTDIEIQQFLGGHLKNFLQSILKSDSSKFLKTLDALIAKEIPSQVFSKLIKDEFYYFKLHLYRGLVYIEWEKQLRKHISVSRMNEIGFLFDDNSPNNWNFLCKALYRLLKFERVFVLQIQETNQSKVIAEQVKTGKISLYGKEFSSSFMPNEVMPYYQSLSYRYVPDFEQLGQQLYSLTPEINKLCSQLEPPPLLHQHYLRSIGVSAAVFFPMYLEGDFWGLVIAQNSKPKKVDLQQRKLATFIVHSAMSKYENLFKQNLIEHNQQLLEVESILKQSLSTKKTINCAMVENMKLLAEMVKADGVAIYNQGDVFFHGTVPNVTLFYELIKHLQTTSSKTIFKDYNFRLNQGHKFSTKLPFAGLLYYTLGSDKDYYIVWFRKEQLSSLVKFDPLNKPKQNILYTWEQTIQDSAIPWDDTDLKFIKGLQHVINESIVGRAAEKQLLTDELRTINNELEMLTFTLSHDLKNPLSILKMGLQFLQKAGQSLSPQKQAEWHKNLSSSVTNIEDIINNIVTVSQSKTAAMAKDAIPMSFTVQKILKEATLLYQSTNCEMYFGRLLPLWGEKSALYQIFLNTINNAVKYSSTCSQPKVWIDSSMDEKQVCYVIKDNGIGIPSENLPHIFDIFNRANNAHAFQGTGVGLSLVKRIMDRLGGLIEVESSEGRGTTIRLYFPITESFPPSML